MLIVCRIGNAAVQLQFSQQYNRHNICLSPTYHCILSGVICWTSEEGGLVPSWYLMLQSNKPTVT